MARSRKKTTAQHVMGIAAMAMPAPLRDIVTTRWGARLSLVAAAALAGSGVLSVDWTDGKPHVQVNKERAREVENTLEQRIAGGVDQFDDKHSQFGNQQSPFGGQQSQFGSQQNQVGSGQTAKERLTDRWNKLKQHK